MKTVLIACVMGLAVACGPAVPAPAELTTGQEACAFCRMSVSQPEFASQVVSPGELPLFFDDLGCLNNYLTVTYDPAPETVIYVTDHASRAWVRADNALFSRVAGASTPMGSHLVAHASAESRASDVAAAGAAPVAVDVVIPPEWQVKGRRP